MQRIKLKNLTLGSMLIAIYAALMILNNFTGRFLSDIIPVTLTAAILTYSKKAKLGPVIAGMIIVTILFGDVTAYVYSSLFIIGATITANIFKKGLPGNKAALLLLLQFFVCEILGGVLILPLLGISFEEKIIALSNTLPSFLGSNILFPLVVVNYILLSLIYSTVDTYITMNLMIKLNSTLKIV